MKTTGKTKSERRSISRVAASAALALPLCGCLLGPDWSEPTPPTSIPERFRGAGSNDAVESGGAAEARIPADEALFQADAESGSGTPAPHDAATAGESWWMRWDDPVLRRLLAEGCATNLTLAQAAERTIQAREAVEAARGGVDLTPRLKQLNYWGACITAAHQKLVADGFEGYLDANGRPNLKYRDKFILMGDRIIKEAIK